MGEYAGVTTTLLLARRDISIGRTFFDYHYLHVRSRRFASAREEIARRTYASDARKSRLRSSVLLRSSGREKIQPWRHQYRGPGQRRASYPRKFANNSYSLERSVSPPRRTLRNNDNPPCGRRSRYGKIAKLNGGNTVVAEACMALIMQYIEIGFAWRLRRGGWRTRRGSGTTGT